MSRPPTGKSATRNVRVVKIKELKLKRDQKRGITVAMGLIHSAHATHSAHTRGHTAHPATHATARRHRRGGALLRHNHVVDAENDRGEVCGESDNLLDGLRGLEDAGFERVFHLLRVQVYAYVSPVRGRVPGPNVDESIDGVKTAILGEGSRHYFEGVCEHVNGHLLATALLAGEVP